MDRQTPSPVTAGLARGAVALGLGLAALLGPAAAAGTDAAGDEVAIGRRIYETGTRADGSDVKGTRWDELVVSGRAAACAQCHRPSGMGSVEGDILVPPVTGRALFGGDKVIATMDPRSGKAFNQAHDPYTDESLARAIRGGEHAGGGRMNVMMPRYQLDDGDMKAVVAYLHQLSAQWAPGVTDKTIRFATVITPDVAPQRRVQYADMVRKIVAQKNGSTMVAGRGTRHHMAGAAELILGTERRWFMDFWLLEGAPETWGAQLDALYARQPVFALVSGLGGDEWGPVDAFCDRQAVPCWFPSVDAPPAANPRYSLYFNRGVALEADVLAARLRGQRDPAPKRLIQVFRSGGAGQAGARELAAALQGSEIAVQDRPLPADGGDLRVALQDAGPKDTVMFWLRPSDIASLQSLAAPAAAAYFSARMGGAERAPIPDAWKKAARLVYPYELPEKRSASLAYFHAWVNQRHVPMFDEPVQSEIYFSLAYLTDTVTEMLDNLYRDYLIERAESMISRREGSKAEAEYYPSSQSHVRTQVAKADGSVEPPPQATPTALQAAGTAWHKREGTTIYPRLVLGPGQRFASKGAYVVRFDDAGALAADGDWIVP